MEHVDFRPTPPPPPPEAARSAEQVAPQLPPAAIPETLFEKDTTPAPTTKRPPKTKKPKDIVQIFNQLTHDEAGEVAALLTNEVLTSAGGNSVIGPEKDNNNNNLAVVSASIYDPRPRTRTYTKNFPKNTAKSKQQLPTKASKQQQQQQQRSQHQNNNNNNSNNSHHKLPIRSGKKYDHFREKERTEDVLEKEDTTRRKQPTSRDQPAVKEVRERPADKSEAVGRGGFFDPDVPGFEPADKGFPTAKRQEEPVFRPLRPVPTSPPLPRILEPTTPQPIFLNIEQQVKRERRPPPPPLPLLPSPAPFSSFPAPAPPPPPARSAPPPSFPSLPPPPPPPSPTVFAPVFQLAPVPSPPARPPTPATPLHPHPPPSPTPPHSPPQHHRHPPTPAFPPLGEVEEDERPLPPPIAAPVHVAVLHSQDPEYEDYDAHEQFKVSNNNPIQYSHQYKVIDPHSRTLTVIPTYTVASTGNS